MPPRRANPPIELETRHLLLHSLHLPCCTQLSSWPHYSLVNNLYSNPPRHPSLSPNSLSPHVSHICLLLSITTATSLVLATISSLFDLCRSLLRDPLPPKHLTFLTCNVDHVPCRKCSRTDFKAFNLSFVTPCLPLSPNPLTTTQLLLVSECCRSSQS